MIRLIMHLFDGLPLCFKRADLAAYTLKFMLKKRQVDPVDYPVMALEGLCVQAMHIGPYATEPETLEKMQVFMREHSYRDLVGAGGKHHEIYLGGPRRAAPEKLKTVLRHPVEEEAR